MNDDEKRDLLRLNLVPGIGPRTQSLLLTRFETAAAVFQAPGDQLLQVEGIGPKLSAAISAARNSDEVDREWERCERSSTTLLFRGTPEYPPLLAETCDAPTVL